MASPDSPPPARYHSVSIALHWLMALGFFLMLGSGVVMTQFELEKSFMFQLYQWHKSGGVLLLLAFILRVIWRLISHIPPLPDAVSGWERRAAHAGHAALYGFMLAMPLSGWVMVSASVFGLPTMVFGWFEWPHIPWVESDKQIEDMAHSAHYYLAIMFGLTIAAHIAGTVKHAVFEKENLLTRMWWGTPRQSAPQYREESCDH